MRLNLYILLFFPLLHITNQSIIPPADEKVLRGEFHDEARVNVDYEDFSTNLTDYASRRSSDDDKMTPEEHRKREEQEREDEDDASEDSSDISEERETDTVDHAHLKSLTAVKPEKHQLPVAGVINSAFNDRKTFSCPRIKNDLLTGTTVADISPEDITIIAAMGDALATGIGLWPNADIEFRGASFPIGGDSTIDGLITIPNILREFSPKIVGVSHGMGSDLPDHQLNVAQTGATTSDLMGQAKDLVRKVTKLTEIDYKREWIMIIITIGTEELCARCEGPSYEHIKQAIEHLQVHLPKALVVLLGPVHVSSFHEQKSNLLKSRCKCSRNQTESFMYDISRKWSKVWKDVAKFVETGPTARNTFGIISYPMVTITSRYPNGLFIRDKPLLNRRGHNYATKWLWNRLIGGDAYNLSSATLSQDNYFCPSVGCPYFRTYANHKKCVTTSFAEAENMKFDIKNGQVFYKPRRRTVEYLYNLAIVVVCAAFCSVCLFGTFFYQKSKTGDHGRFEIVEEPQKKLEEAQKEEQKALLTRQNTRAQSELALNNVNDLAPMPVGRHKSFLGTIKEGVPDV